MTCKECKFFVQGERHSGTCMKKQYATHRSGQIQRKPDGAPYPFVMSGDRYISQNALITEIAKIHGNLNTKNVGQAIWDTPTADVVEVRHGEWIYHECVSSYDGCKSGYSCSMCNAFVDEEIFDTDEFHKAFCGNCGAKMDGERKDNAN